MKYIEAFFVLNVWAIMCSISIAHGSKMSVDAQVLSCAIIIAGVLAGHER